jgi:hypothetical protein
MEGAALAVKRQFDIAITMAWHTEAFARTKKLPKLSALIGDGPKAGSKAAEAVAWAHRMKARGFDIQITKHELN